MVIAKNNMADRRGHMVITKNTMAQAWPPGDNKEHYGSGVATW